MEITELRVLSPLSLCFIVASALLTYSTWLVFYRLYFHPLANFPGPKLAIVSYWYEFYFEVFQGGRYTWKLMDLHKQYGPIIRLNPDELHISDPDYYGELFSTKRKMNKPLRAGDTFGPLTASFAAVTHELHRIRRAPLNHHFSKRSVGELQPWIVLSIEKLCGRFENAIKSREIVNLKYAYAALSHDIIYQYCFSRTLDSVMLPNFDKEYVDALDGGNQMTPIIFEMHWLGVLFHSLPGWLAKLLNPRFAQLLDERDKVSTQIEAISAGKDKAFESSQHPTVLHDLVNSDLPPTEKAPHRLRDEAQTLIGAGTSTTAVTFMITTCHLVTNPEKRLKLFQELKTALPDPYTVLPLQTLEQLPYLTAVILEGLRLAHPSSHRLLRYFPDSSLIYGGMTIPPGTIVSMTAIHLHENPDIFPDSFEFRPERWLMGDQQRLRRYLVPFSKGTRSCLGINLAYAELYLAIAIVFRRFNFELQDVVKERDFVVSRDTLIGSTSADSKGVPARVIRAEQSG